MHCTVASSIMASRSLVRGGKHAEPSMLEASEKGGQMTIDSRGAVRTCPRTVVGELAQVLARSACAIFVSWVSRGSRCDQQTSDPLDRLRQRRVYPFFAKCSMLLDLLSGRLLVSSDRWFPHGAVLVAVLQMRWIDRSVRIESADRVGDLG